MESPHEIAIHLDGLADIQEGARSASEQREERKKILAEGVSLEVVHSHGDEIELGIGVMVEESERHDANARFEGKEVGLVVRASFREDRNAFLGSQGLPHGCEHFVVIDVREELTESRVFREYERFGGRRVGFGGRERRGLRFREIQKQIGVASHFADDVGAASDLNGALRGDLRSEFCVCSLNVKTHDHSHDDVVTFHSHRSTELPLYVLVTFYWDNGRHELHEEAHDLVLAKTGSCPDIVNLSRQVCGNHNSIDELIGMGSTYQHHGLILRNPFRMRYCDL